MSNTSGSSSNGSRMEVPEAKAAMDRFKMEVANEIGVNLKRRLQRRFNICTGWFYRWRDGSSDDQKTGRTDGR